MASLLCKACRSKTPIKAAFARISISRKMHVEAIPMRWGMGDNYAYLLSDSNTGQSWLIDPAEPVEVESFLTKHKSAYTLKAIVNTHHHYDHSQGNAFFHAKHPQLPIIAGSQSPLVTYTPSNKEVINVGDDLRITALHTPCHTQDSICYYAEDRKTGERAVFTGDTLFISGCGRFFEGTAQEMDQALNGVLASLPKDTKVFPGHEYTKGNVKFSSKILHNDAIKRLEAYTESHSQTTGQFTIGDELEFNPFMRLNDPQVQAATKEHDPTRVMQKLREMKNKM